MRELFVGEQSEFREQDRKIIAHGKLEIGIFRICGGFFAYQNYCVHRGGPICQGKILNKGVRRRVAAFLWARHVAPFQSGLVRPHSKSNSHRR